MVAGVDLDLVASEVAQVGDDCGLLGEYRHHRLGALEGLLVLVVGHACAVWRAGGCGEEGLWLIGDAYHGAPQSGSSGQGEQD